MARRAVLNNVAEMLQNAGRMLEDLNSTENSKCNGLRFLKYLSPHFVYDTENI
jgi:hypothetical protein